MVPWEGKCSTDRMTRGITVMGGWMWWTWRTQGIPVTMLVALRICSCSHFVTWACGKAVWVGIPREHSCNIQHWCACMVLPHSGGIAETADNALTGSTDSPLRLLRAAAQLCPSQGFRLSGPQTFGLSHICPPDFFLLTSSKVPGSSPKRSAWI